MRTVLAAIVVLIAIAALVDVYVEDYRGGNEPAAQQNAEDNRAQPQAAKSPSRARAAGRKPATVATVGSVLKTQPPSHHLPPPLNILPPQYQ